VNWNSDFCPPIARVSGADQQHQSARLPAGSAVSRSRASLGWVLAKSVGLGDVRSRSHRPVPPHQPLESRGVVYGHWLFERLGCLRIFLMPSRQDRECAHPVACETGERQVVAVDHSEVHRVRQQRASQGVLALAGCEVP
jgi:hypothetical protein